MQKINISRDDSLYRAAADIPTLGVTATGCAFRELELLAAVDHVFGRTPAQNPGKGL